MSKLVGCVCIRDSERYGASMMLFELVQRGLSIVVEWCLVVEVGT